MIPSARQKTQAGNSSFGRIASCFMNVKDGTISSISLEKTEENDGPSTVMYLNVESIAGILKVWQEGMTPDGQALLEKVHCHV